MVSGKEWNQLMEDGFWRVEEQKVEKSSLYLTKEDIKDN